MNTDFSTPPPHVGCGILRDSLAIFLSLLFHQTTVQSTCLCTRQTATSPPHNICRFVSRLHRSQTRKCHRHWGVCIVRPLFVITTAEPDYAEYGSATPDSDGFDFNGSTLQNLTSQCCSCWIGRIRKVIVDTI